MNVPPFFSWKVRDTRVARTNDALRGISNYLGECLRNRSQTEVPRTKSVVRSKEEQT